MWGVLALVVLLVAVEAYTRFWLGWCDVPLYMQDDSIEYLLQPNQDCLVQRHRFITNAFSMRSGPITEQRADPTEARVLLLGDSVVNGGIHTDQSELASTLLAEWLSEDLDRPVIVGNVSCSSWGPPNYLEYIRRFGTFDADIIVIVLTAGDSSDVPTFEERVGKPAWPDRKPLLGVWGAARKLLDKMTRRAGEDRPALRDADRVPSQEDVDAAIGALSQMVRIAEEAGAQPLIVQHLMERELQNGKSPGHAHIEALAQARGVEIVPLGPAFAEAIASGLDPYRDWVHPNAEGYRITAEALRPRLRALLQEGADHDDK